ncbi:hypothetical protein Patl1_34640 [Pistacia atlantica]|uniref:Uncharacterized protein n=1 Tax=Pistacia atlantica TaxID=434234 RepID=A0ACC0ZQ52_9ROSI|nr:hypothetical protein Patl1_34640 [Pistacia atlantica]
MGISRKPFSLSEKSKRITKLSPSTANHDQFLRAARPARRTIMDAGEWRTHLPPGSRQRIVNKIMDKLKRHPPFSCQEGLNELKNFAGRFEEKMYTAATSQSDYLRRICLKILSMESKYQNPMPNSLPSNTAANSDKPLDQGNNIHENSSLKTQKTSLATWSIPSCFLAG